jgi:hypothetical protein
MNTPQIILTSNLLLIAIKKIKEGKIDFKHYFPFFEED